MARTINDLIRQLRIGDTISGKVTSSTHPKDTYCEEVDAQITSLNENSFIVKIPITKADQSAHTLLKIHSFNVWHVGNEFKVCVDSSEPAAESKPGNLFLFVVRDQYM